MRNLLALLLFVPNLCLAQLPEFVSETGLVGWYGFNNNFNDSSLGDNHGVSSGASFTSDRFSEPNAAASIEAGSFIDLGMESNMVLTPQDAITIAFWSHPNNDEGSLITKYQNGNGPGSSWYIKDGLSGGVIAFGNGTSGTPNPTGYYNLCPNATSDWTHITVVFLGSQVTIWLNGAEVCTVTMPVSPSDSQPQPVLVGRSNCTNGTNCNNNGSFAIDELGLWERALTAEEIQALFLADPLIYGCTDQEACNFQIEANADDGSCVSCEVLASACGEGTVWDSTLAQCVSVAPPCAPSCGEGTIWDPVNEECMIAIPTDNDLDGCVSASDVLNLLSTFGTCPPIPEWPDEPIPEACLTLVEHHLSVNCSDFSPPADASFVDEGCAGTWVNAGCDTAWHLVDNQPPVLDPDYVPFLVAPCSEIILEAQALDPNILTPPFFDDCSGELTYSVDAYPMSGGCVYSWERQWTATDACGNVSEVMPQLIMISDDEPPLVMAPPDTTLTMIIECGMQINPSLTGFASAHDACLDGAEAVFGQSSYVMDSLSYSDVISPDPCAPGEAPTTLTITRTWTTVDYCDNPGQAIQVITVQAP